MSEGKNSSPNLAKGKAVRWGAALLAFLGGTAFAIRGIEELTNKEPDVLNVVDNLNGFNSFFREALSLHLPGGVQLKQINLQLSEGTAANLKNPNLNSSSYFYTTILRPNGNLFTILSDNSKNGNFNENQDYSVSSIVRIANEKLKLEWTKLEYTPQDNVLYTTNASEKTITNINTAINQSLLNGYGYKGTSADISSSKFKLREIDCTYSVNPNVNPGPLTVSYCAYKIDLPDSTIGINIVNTEGIINSTLYVNLNTLTPTQDMQQGRTTNNISIDPADAKEFLRSIKFAGLVGSQHV